jgi:hypothetical protein
MLLFGGINRVFHLQNHRFSAANQLTLSTVKNFYDIAAQLTLVNLISFSHLITPSKVWVNSIYFA